MIKDLKESFQKKQIIIIFCLFVISVIFAIINKTPYHPDEHFQILEFLGSKTDKTPVNELAWEYKTQIRPWMQIGIYYIINKIFLFLNISDPFVISTAFRFFSIIFGIISIMLFFLAFKKHFKDKESENIYLLLASFLWVIPWFISRCSSETLSGIFVLMGVSLLYYYYRNKEVKLLFIPLIITGIIFGFAFQFRFQISFMIFGACLWFLIFSEDKFLKRIINVSFIVIGFIMVFVLGIIVDSWGYGKLNLTFYKYFYVNIVLKAANHFGVDPLWGYFYLIPLSFKEIIILPILIMISYIIFCIRYPKDIITWATLPLIVIHTIISHKEGRFLYPVILFMPFILIMSILPKKEDFFIKLYNLRKNILFKILYILNFIGIIFLLFWGPGFKETIIFQKYIYTNFKDGFEGYITDNKESEYPFQFAGLKSYFYRPKYFKTTILENIDKVEDILKEKEQIYLIARYTNLSSEDKKGYNVKEVFVIKENNFIQFQIKQIIKLTINKIKKDKFDLSLPNKNICVLYLIERNHNTD